MVKVNILEMSALYKLDGMQNDWWGERKKAVDLEQLLKHGIYSWHVPCALSPFLLLPVQNVDMTAGLPETIWDLENGSRDTKIDEQKDKGFWSLMRREALHQPLHFFYMTKPLCVQATVIWSLFLVAINIIIVIIVMATRLSFQQHGYCLLISEFLSHSVFSRKS